jgi:tetraacyldisaccharide 4'-kinase
MRESPSAEDWFISVVSGERRGTVAAIARAVFSTGAPIYAAAVQARNFLYTRQILKAAHARRPVISVGNLTTGGTGKTPIVAWLVEQLRSAGRTPAVLLRGYKSAGGDSDEELLLRELVTPSPVRAQADRFAGSERVLAEHPDVDVFVLDDGFQHRRLARHFNLLLVDATRPFGFGHVLPRGLLREPMRGIRRAHTVVITRADLVDAGTLEGIEKRIRAEQADVPIFRCGLKQDRVIDADGREQSIATLRGEKVFAICGIGNPRAFFGQIEQSGAAIVGTRAFGDHHRYTVEEIGEVLARAKVDAASVLVMTEKDWVKVAPMVRRLPGEPRMMRVGLSVEIENAAKLVELVMDGTEEGDRLLGWRDRRAMKDE